MNLLAKYRTMLRPSPPLSLVVDNKTDTEEREKVKKGFIGELPAISALSPPVAKTEVSNRLAPTHPEIVQPEPLVGAVLPVWVNSQAKGTKEAREESLQEVLTAIYHTATADAGGMPARICSCLDLDTIEKEISSLWKKVIENNTGVNSFSEFLSTIWIPALREANRRLQDGLEYDAEERYCIQNEGTITEKDCSLIGKPLRGKDT